MKKSNVVELFKRDPIKANVVTNQMVPNENDIRSFLKTLRHIQSISPSQTIEISTTLSSLRISIKHANPHPDSNTHIHTHFSEVVDVDMLLHTLDDNPTDNIVDEMVSQTTQAIESLIPDMRS